MNHEQHAQTQIQRQIDLLNAFSMPSWRLSRWFFSLPAWVAKWSFLFIVAGVFSAVMVAAYLVANQTVSLLQLPPDTRFFVVVLVVVIGGVVLAGPLAWAGQNAWKALKRRTPCPSEVWAIRELIEDAKGEPALKKAIQRALEEEGSDMLTQRQVDALMEISQKLTQLRDEEQRRLDGLDALETLGLVTAARNHGRATALEKALPGAAFNPSSPARF